MKPEELHEYKLQQARERANRELQTRLESMTPEKREEFNRRRNRLETYRKLSHEERAKIRKDRKAASDRAYIERRKRKAQLTDEDRVIYETVGSFDLI